MDHLPQKGANAPVCGLTWPILITFELAALAVVPRKITGPAIAVATSSLITSRRRHNLLAEFPVLISVVSVTPQHRLSVSQKKLVSICIIRSKSLSVASKAVVII